MFRVSGRFLKPLVFTKNSPELAWFDFFGIFRSENTWERQNRPTDGQDMSFCILPASACHLLPSKSAKIDTTFLMDVDTNNSVQANFCIWSVSYTQVWDSKSDSEDLSAYGMLRLRPLDIPSHRYVLICWSTANLLYFNKWVRTNGMGCLMVVQVTSPPSYNICCIT